MSHQMLKEFDSCSCCGSYEDRAKLSIIRFIHDGQSTSVCLCDDCVALLEALFEDAKEKKKSDEEV